MPKYKFLRDSEIHGYPESEIRVLETRQEIIDFGIRSLMQMLEELRNSDCRDLDLYVDVFEMLYHIAEISFIELDLIDRYGDEKLDDVGGYSKYLLRVVEVQDE